ncbi:MAG TPA: FecR domain-containing protein [Terriglobia bacterium]|nr:FecR domain-containing protein [Terriglobia bacterium]
MATLMFVLMMQFVVSTRAGLVNYVQGDVNVKAMQSMQAGTAVRTGRDGLAEVLLNPGSFLRLDRDSEVVLEGIELTDIAVRVVSGTAVIEAVDFSKDMPLKVTTGNLAIEIIKDGIYKFSDRKVTIIEGKLQAADNKIAFTKGWELSRDQTYRAMKVAKGTATPLENWSRSRSELIARANVNVANTLRRSPPVLSGYGWTNAWMFIPGFGAYIFMPGYHYRSPYGYEYLTFVPESRGGGGSGYESAGGGSGGSVGNSGGGSGGGSSAPSVPIQSRPIGPQIGTDRPSPSLGKPGL